MNSSEFNESFSSNPEAQHPEQLTLHSLFNKIIQLTDLNAGHLPWDREIARSIQMYQVPSTLAEAEQNGNMLMVTRFNINNNPSQLASITQTEQLGTGPDMLRTKYDLENSPDGLQIEKHMKIVNIHADRLLGFAPQQSEAVQRELARRVEAERTAYAEEAASGLSFVSETEARELLRMLEDDFIPINRKLK